MPRLYDRKVKVTLARPVNTSEFFALQPNAVIVEDLRVQFQIEKSLGKEPNTCSVTIHNLAERTRAETIQKPLHVRLDAGYGEDPKRLFAGDLIWGHSRKPELNWLTTMQLGDGARAYKHARARRSFKAGTSVNTVLKDLAGTMGLKVPTNVAGAKEFAKQFTTGVSIEGPSRLELDRLVKVSGMGYSIQDGTLQILRDGEFAFVEAIPVSEDTGMIGTPEFGAPKDRKSKPVLTVRMLLEPRLRPGGAIELKARDIKGLFGIKRVTHTGDSRGRDWYSTVEAVAR
jgi:hypothetical protein